MALDHVAVDAEDFVKNTRNEIQVIVPMEAKPALKEENMVDLTANGPVHFPFSVWSRLQREVLLDHAEDNYEFRQVFFEGQTINQLPVENGENSVVTRPAKTASTVLPVELDETKLTWIYGDTTGTIQAPVTEGQKISTVQVWYGAKCLAQADLVAANAVNVYTAPVVPTEPDGAGDSKVGMIVVIIAGVLLGAAVVVVLIRLVIRWAKKLKRNARLRRRREDRRRSR